MSMPLSIKEQVYGINRKLKISKERLITHKDVSDRNRELILEFVQYAEAKGLSAHRILMYIKHMRLFAKYLKADFDKATRDDIEIAFSKLNSNGYSAWTLETYRRLVKAYWRWLYKLDKTDRLPDCVRWIECTRPPSKLCAEDLLTSDEISKLILATDNLQYKALISLMVETGARIGEIMQMTNRDIYINDKYIKIRINSGKTIHNNGSRDVFLIKSYSSFLAWVNNHPMKKQKVYPIWISNRRKAINQRSIGNILERLAEKAGITKRIYPYLFRHTLATHLYKTKPAPVVRKLLGHSEKMESVYAHLSSDDVLEMLLGKQIKKDEIIRTCSRCKTENGFVSDFCSKCGLVLTEIGARSKQNEVENIVMQVLENRGHDDISKVIEVKEQ
jgi:integrase/recombinase XerD